MKVLLGFSFLLVNVSLSICSSDLEFSPLLRKKRASTIQLTTEDIKVAVDKHNEYRRIVQPPASNMIELVWNSNLASLAESYSKMCIYAHNPNRVVQGFSYVGENLYIRSNEQTASVVFENSITSWDNEKNVYDYETQACGGVCGHYTQSVWAMTHSVGCAVTTCTDIQVGSRVWPTGQLVVCNYGPGGNYAGVRPYESGSWCSACPNSNYTCSDNLCVRPSSAQNVIFNICMILLSVIASFLYTLV